MSTFKVGQRVRIVRHASGPNPNPRSDLPSPIGMEATILGIPAALHGWDCSVMPDGYPPTGRTPEIGYAAMFASLEPLTDPSADAFMERLKKLGREPVNSPEKVTV